MSKVTNFVNEVVARLKGDTDAVVAAQNERKALSAFTQQISALEAQLVDDEIAVDEAVDVYNNALYPTTKITDTKVYLNKIVSAKSSLDVAEANKQSTVESIAFFKSEMKKAFAEVK